MDVDPSRLTHSDDRPFVRSLRSVLLLGACLAIASCGTSSSAGDAGAPTPDASSSADAPDGGCATDPVMVARRRVVVYFPLSLGGVYNATTIDFTIVTHVVEHAVCTDAYGNLNLTALGKDFPVPNLVLDVHEGGAKAVLGLCANAGPDVFGQMASQASTRASYVKNVMALVKEYGFDGIDIDWEFPASSTDETELTKLMTELRDALGPDLTLSITGPPTPQLAQYYDFGSLVPLLDWFGAQTYGYTGPTESATASPDAPLISVDGDPSIETSITYYLGQGIPASQLLMGVVYYGKQYDGASELREHLNNHNGNESVPYSSIVPLIGNGWHEYRDPSGQPYLLETNGNPGVLVFDDPTSIEAKCSYAASHCLGGTIVWNIGQDVIGTTQPLLEATRGCR
jgi:Glycosyl hydrolases family 18